MSFGKFNTTTKFSAAAVSNPNERSNANSNNTNNNRSNNNQRNASNTNPEQEPIDAGRANALRQVYSWLANFCSWKAINGYQVYFTNAIYDFVLRHNHAKRPYFKLTAEEKKQYHDDKKDENDARTEDFNSRVFKPNNQDFFDVTRDDNGEIPPSCISVVLLFSVEDGQVLNVDQAVRYISFNEIKPLHWPQITPENEKAATTFLVHLQAEQLQLWEEFNVEFGKIRAEYVEELKCVLILCPEVLMHTAINKPVEPAEDKEYLLGFKSIATLLALSNCTMKFVQSCSTWEREKPALYNRLAQKVSENADFFDFSEIVYIPDPNNAGNRFAINMYSVTDLQTQTKTSVELDAPRRKFRGVIMTLFNFVSQCSYILENPSHDLTHLITNSDRTKLRFINFAEHQQLKDAYESLEQFNTYCVSIAPLGFFHPAECFAEFLPVKGGSREQVPAHLKKQYDKWIDCRIKFVAFLYCGKEAEVLKRLNKAPSNSKFPSLESKDGMAFYKDCVVPLRLPAHFVPATLNEIIKQLVDLDRSVFTYDDEKNDQDAAQVSTQTAFADAKNSEGEKVPDAKPVANPFKNHHHDTERRPRE